MITIIPLTEESIKFSLSTNTKAIDIVTEKPLKRMLGAGVRFILNGTILEIGRNGTPSNTPWMAGLDAAPDMTYGDTVYPAVQALAIVGSTLRVITPEPPYSQAQQEDLQNRVQALRGENAALQAELERLTQARDALLASQGSAESLRTELEAAETKLAEAREKEAELKEKVESLKQNDSELKNELARLNRQIQRYNDQISKNGNLAAELRKTLQRVTEEAEQCSPAVLKELQTEIDALTAQYNKDNETLQELQGDRDFQQSQCDAQQEQIDEVEQEIKAQPEELRRLEEEYGKLSQRLERILHAEEECSEEQQQRLREQIAEQEPTAERLTEQYRVLQEQDEALKARIAADGKQIDARIRELWPALLELMQRLQGNVNEKNEELDRLYETAVRFSEQVRSCADKTEMLRQWYETDRNPLEKLLIRLGEGDETENAQLRQTLVLDKQERLRSLFMEVENGLNTLDDLLREAVNAAQYDERYLRLRSEVGEERADADMKKRK